MTNQAWMVGTIGLLGGIVLTILVAGGYYSSNHHGAAISDMMRMLGGNNSSVIVDKSPMGKSMDDMMGIISGQTGDNFDQAFITQMIFHHQGAIDMAIEAKNQAKHAEIIQLANNIITSQTKEIDQMKSWYKTWYGTDWSGASDLGMMH